MSDDMSFQISIPADNDGYILLQCEHCGEYFKLTVADCEDDGVLSIRCPGCGLISDSFITDDVMKLALAKTENYAMDAIFDAFKDLEKKTKNSFISISAGKKPVHKREDPIRTGIEAMEIAGFSCCKRTAKIKPILRITGCYCPFCGVKNYETEQN